MPKWRLEGDCPKKGADLLRRYQAIPQKDQTFCNGKENLVLGSKKRHDNICIKLMLGG